MNFCPMLPVPEKLTSGEVHVYRLTGIRFAPWQSGTAHLSPIARARAARFYREEDRARFVTVRTVLRRLLAAYLGIAPDAVTFVYGLQGKPALASAWESESLHFNVSYSRDVAVLVFARERQVGIDVECIREIPEVMELAARFFAPEESAALSALPDGARTQGFFNCWTRKEAFIKALGDGLHYPLDRFVVTLHPDRPAALLSVKGDAGGALRWHLRALDLGPGYAAALVVERGADCILRPWHLALSPDAGGGLRFEALSVGWRV